MSRCKLRRNGKYLEKEKPMKRQKPTIEKKHGTTYIHYNTKTKEWKEKMECINAQLREKYGETMHPTIAG
jgi:hypothetical protein